MAKINSYTYDSDVHTSRVIHSMMDESGDTINLVSHCQNSRRRKPMFRDAMNVYQQSEQQRKTRDRLRMLLERKNASASLKN